MISGHIDKQYESEMNAVFAAVRADLDIIFAKRDEVLAKEIASILAEEE